MELVTLPLHSGYIPAVEDQLGILFLLEI